jgi:predicted Co/Zn/Cd cation transporter (cation efflux family)
MKWATTKVDHATILQAALEYPYTIIFRVGMMYSLFIYFLELLFIKWWLDSLPLAKGTTKMVVLGTIGLAAYGLFVSCIDRKRINYQLAEAATSVASIGVTIAIYIIMNNLRKNRAQGIALANERSWFLKKLFSYIYFGGFVLGVLIYGGYADIHYKVIVEYTTVISAALFFWTFSIDFKKFKMDVEQIEKPSNQVNLG